MEAIGKLFGGGSKAPQGPSKAELAIQQQQANQANQANAEADNQAAIAARLGSLRTSLAYRDREKKNTLG